MTVPAELEETRWPRAGRLAVPSLPQFSPRQLRQSLHIQCNFQRSRMNEAARAPTVWELQKLGRKCQRQESLSDAAVSEILSDNATAGSTRGTSTEHTFVSMAAPTYRFHFCTRPLLEEKCSNRPAATGPICDGASGTASPCRR